jgi:hypothetical protein
MKKAKNGALLEWIERHSLYSGDDCVLWPFGTFANGYGAIHFRGTHMSANRAMCILVHGEPESEGLHAAHTCGNRLCCNPKHIRWATASENMADKRDHGTQPMGELAAGVKLTEGDVHQIRALKNRVPCKQIAAMFGIGYQTVNDIHNRHMWAHLPMLPAEKHAPTSLQVDCTPRGSANGTSKLTEAQVLEIRAIGRQLTGRTLAHRYGVEPSVISNILKGKTWRHLLPATGGAS